MADPGDGKRIPALLSPKSFLYRTQGSDQNQPLPSRTLVGKEKERVIGQRDSWHKKRKTEISK